MPRGSANAVKTHCPANHELTGDNLRISNHATGTRRVCRQCVREQKQAAYAAGAKPVRKGRK